MNWKGFQIAAWVGIAMLGAAMLVVALRGEWLRVATLAAFMVISIVFVVREHKMPHLFDTIFVIAALINAGGWTWNLYNQPGPYDEIAHFFTMFAIALAAGFLLYDELMAGFYDHRVMFVVTITCMGIAIGALWEVVEWLADYVTPMQIVSGQVDTMTDILLDAAGSLSAALLNLHGLNERAQEQAPAVTGEGVKAKAA
jgi:hypothetical protein